MNKGITVAGNLIADYIKFTDTYPKRGMLANITSVQKATGGCVPNTILALAKLDNTLKLKALGRVGNDKDGAYLIKELKKYGIDVSGIKSCAADTSFTDAFYDADGERTFFHAKGASEEFCPEDIDINALDCRILHIGYLLLLDKFDKPSVMPKFLQSLRARGIKTSIDVVSDTSGKFKETVLPALPFCDYAIMNEIEAGMAVDIEPRYGNNTLDIKALKAILERFVAAGVKEKAVIHCPELGCCMDKNKKFTVVPSLELPKGFIKSSVGAGDAFCAGALYGFYNNMDDETMLKIASAVAAMSLSETSVAGGIKSAAEVLDFERQLTRIRTGS